MSTTSEPVSGEDIKAFRERHGISQATLGSLVDIPANTIAKWERGDQPIRHATLLALALDSLNNRLQETIVPTPA